MRTLMMTFAVALAGVASSGWASGQQLDETPPLSVRAALDDALARNPRLVVLRREYEALQYRPAQALALAPPSFEAQIWQWPINTVNPSHANMYMFTIGQTLPGRGKRALQAAVAEKDAELARATIAVGAQNIVSEV